jgi:DNA-binding NarL/FixJ family response regulator
VFQRLFEDAQSEPQTSEGDVPAKPSRSDSIVTLSKGGKTVPQIARELGITQNEVNLVIGLTGKR